MPYLNIFSLKFKNGEKNDCVDVSSILAKKSAVSKSIARLDFKIN